MKLTSTMERALALHDQGQLSAAARVAGGKAYLESWLAKRGVVAMPRLKAAADGRQGRSGPRDYPQKSCEEPFEHRLARVHAELPVPDGTKLVYHTRSGRHRGTNHMKVIARVFRAAALVVVSLRAVGEPDMIVPYTRRTAQDARAMWLMLVLGEQPDVRDTELAATLYVDVEEVIDIKLYHKMRLETCETYRGDFETMQRSVSRRVIESAKPREPGR
jgi:hypothetical protein